MTQWEYLEAVSLDGMEWRVTGTEDRRPLVGIANKIGVEGWELVGTYTIGGLYLKTWRAIFKRPYEVTML